MQTVELSRVAVVLQPFVESFQTDGYDVAVAARDGTLVVTITAGPDACEECLIDKEIMAGMIASTLSEQGVSVPVQAIELVYPTAHP